MNILGYKYMGAIPSFKILLFSCTFLVAFQIIWHLFIVYDKPLQALLSTSLFLGIFIPIEFLLVPPYGATGAALALLTATGLISFYGVWACRRIGINFNFFHFLKPAFAGLSGIGLIYFIPSISDFAKVWIVLAIYMVSLIFMKELNLQDIERLSSLIQCNLRQIRLRYARFSSETRGQ